MKKYLSLFAALYFTTASVANGETFGADPSHITSQSQLEQLQGSLGGADTGIPKAITALALALIKDFEAWRARVYNDAAGYCTVGYGHLIAKSRCEALGDLGKFSGALPVADGLALLELDTRLARRTVSKAVTVTLNDDQFGALSSFVFNVGSENFNKSTLLRLLNQGDQKAASKQFMRWIRAKGVVFDGLIERRSCEAALFRGEVKLDGAGLFDRASCASLGAAPSAADIVDIEVGE